MQALWFWLVSVMVVLYAVLDGYDFGCGILHRCVAKTNAERREVLGAIGPFWDGNEVWLIAGGGALLVAFPKVLAAGFSGLYLAMFLVIWTLLLRGIAIEFRSHLGNGLWRAFWDGCFLFASVLMPVFLGVALGNVIRGVPLDARGQFNLTLFTDFRPQGDVGILDYYTVLVGVFVWCALACHGALFLTWKTRARVQARAARLVVPLWATTLGLVAVLTPLTVFVNPSMFDNLRHAPIAWFGLLLYVSSLGGVYVWHRKGRSLLAFLSSAGFIVGILLTTAACVFPILLRSTLDPTFSLSAYNASASMSSLRAGAVWWFIGFPLALGYVFLLQYLHRGKVPTPKDGEGY